MPAVIVRPAEPADSEALFDMTRELCEFEKLLHEFTSTQTLLHDALFGEDPAAEALVAIVDGSVAGYALWFGTLSTFTGHRGLYLEDLYVKAPYRGSGIGTKLLRAVAAVAVQKKRVRMEWTVLEWNIAAKEFYKRMGAEIEPDWRVVRAKGGELAALAQQ
jgi:GNAT superfamily N-acetyltransferase